MVEVRVHASHEEADAKLKPDTVSVGASAAAERHTAIDSVTRKQQPDYRSLFFAQLGSSLSS